MGCPNKGMVVHQVLLIGVDVCLVHCHGRQKGKRLDCCKASPIAGFSSFQPQYVEAENGALESGKMKV